jgi:hypothetical protein
MTNRYLAALRQKQPFGRTLVAGNCDKSIEGNQVVNTILSHMSHMSHSHPRATDQAVSEIPSRDRDKSDKSDLIPQVIDITDKPPATKVGVVCDQRVECCVCHRPLAEPPTTWWGAEPCHYQCGLSAWEQAYKQRG